MNDGMIIRAVVFSLWVFQTKGETHFGFLWACEVMFLMEGSVWIKVRLLL